MQLIGLVVAVLGAGATAPVLARHSVAAAVQHVVALKDGSTLYVFKDGKMAREDKFGRPTVFERDEVLEAVDGRKLTATVGEVMRLDVLLNDGHEH